MEKRNFCIVAHIDHGKTTLTDRFIEITGVLPEIPREQYLDKLRVERERGITVKSQTVRLMWKGVVLNLIDTPGHVDFTYEVSRAMSACEGAILLVDATKGVQAQTLSHAYLAVERGLEIIPVINKIDLQTADSERTKREIEEIIGIPADNAICVSAKTGENVNEVLDAVVKLIPPPSGLLSAPFKALIFDSWYDNFWGVVCLIRVFEGSIKKNDEVKIFSTGKTYKILRLGVFSPEPEDVDNLVAGDVCFLILGMKDIREAKVGDTICHPSVDNPLEGFRELKPMVFAGFYPVEPEGYPKLKDAIQKLMLNDSALTFQPETSPALGQGFRMGFLGSLHMEVTAQRLSDEFNLDVIMTVPQVVYKAVLKRSEVEIKSPADFPSPEKMQSMKEPYLLVTVHTPQEYLGGILKVCEDARGNQIDMKFTSDGKVILTYEIPMSSCIFGFNDKIKSASKGYASWDYEFQGYKPADIVKLDVLINGRPVDAVSFIVPKEQAYRKAREIASKLREVIPRQLFEVSIQVAYGSRVMAKENIKPFRKDVTAKCYGGDVTRKRKLLEKQKEGKKRLKAIGQVEVPKDAFIEVFKIG